MLQFNTAEVTWIPGSLEHSVIPKTEPDYSIVSRLKRVSDELYNQSLQTSAIERRIDTGADEKPETSVYPEDPGLLDIVRGLEDRVVFLRKRLERIQDLL